MEPGNDRKHPPFNVIFFFLCDNCRCAVIKASSDRPRPFGSITQILCGECHPFALNALDVLNALDRRITIPAKAKIEEWELYRDLIIGNIKHRMGLKDSIVPSLEHKYRSIIARCEGEIGDGVDSEELEQYRSGSLVAKILAYEVEGWPYLQAPTASGEGGPRSERLSPSDKVDFRRFLRPYGYTWVRLKKRKAANAHSTLSKLISKKF